MGGGGGGAEAEASGREGADGVQARAAGEGSDQEVRSGFKLDFETRLDRTWQGIRHVR